MRRVLVIAFLFAIAGLIPAASQAQTETVTYYHTDAIGSVRMTTDAAGQVLGRYDYQPFGLPLDQTPAPPAERLQFAGKERDTETGFGYFGGRYYFGLHGRFTTVDPVLDIDQARVDPQRWNRYTYALNNLLKFTDPDGRDPRVLGGAIGAVVYAGWNTSMNIQQGHAWYQNIGIEASKGFLVGVALGLAAPAVATPAAVEIGIAVGGKSAFETAMEGGRHSGFLRNYAGRPAGELRHGIASLERQIAIHLDKIKNPAKYIEELEKLDPRQQKALLEKTWPSEIQLHREQFDILKRLLEENYP